MMMMMGVIVIVLLVYNQIQGFIHYIGSENVTKIEKNSCFDEIVKQLCPNGFNEFKNRSIKL